MFQINQTLVSLTHLLGDTDRVSPLEGYPGADSTVTRDPVEEIFLEEEVFDPEIQELSRAYHQPLNQVKCTMSGDDGITNSGGAPAPDYDD